METVPGTWRTSAYTPRIADVTAENEAPNAESACPHGHLFAHRVGNGEAGGVTHNGPCD